MGQDSCVQYGVSTDVALQVYKNKNVRWKFQFNEEKSAKIISGTIFLLKPDILGNTEFYA